MKVRNLQAAYDNATCSKDWELGAHLHTCASIEHAGAPTTALQTAPFKAADGQVRPGDPPLQLPQHMRTTEALR